MLLRCRNRLDTDQAEAGAAAPLAPAACFFLRASARRFRCSRFNRFRRDLIAASPSVLAWLVHFAAIFFFNLTSSGSVARFFAI